MGENNIRQVLFTSHLRSGMTIELLEMDDGKIAIRFGSGIPFCRYAADAMDQAMSAFKCLADGAPIQQHPKD